MNTYFALTILMLSPLYMVIPYSIIHLSLSSYHLQGIPTNIFFVDFGICCWFSSCLLSIQSLKRKILVAQVKINFYDIFGISFGSVDAKEANKPSTREMRINIVS